MIRDIELSDRDKRIIQLRFGIGFTDGVKIETHTYGQIGHELNLSQERVRQLTIRAVKKLVALQLRNFKLVWTGTREDQLT